MRAEPRLGERHPGGSRPGAGAVAVRRAAARRRGRPAPTIAPSRAADAELTAQEVQLVVDGLDVVGQGGRLAGQGGDVLLGRAAEGRGPAAGTRPAAGPEGAELA